MFPAFYVPGLRLLDFTSQFAPDSPVKAPLFLICFVVTVKGREGRPEGCGTVTDEPHPSIRRSANNESALRNVYTGGMRDSKTGQLLHSNTALNLLETLKA